MAKVTGIIRSGKAKFGLICLALILNVQMILLHRNLGSAFMIIGMLSNALVVAFNGFRMPVKVPRGKKVLDTPTHFSYKNNNKIKLQKLSDIIPVKTKKHVWVFSIGDIFLIVGFIIIIGGIWLK